MPHWISRALSWIAVALVGVVYGAAGTIAHSLTWELVPVGFIVGTIACTSLLVAVRTLTHDRGATIVASVGMLGMLVVISGPGPGGSVIVPDSPLGQLWIYTIGVVALLVISWPTLKSRTISRAEAEDDEAMMPIGS